MLPLSDHPALAGRREAFAPMTDVDRLAVDLRSLLHLDPTAVYHTRGNSTIVYYHSPHAEPCPPGTCTRIVLDERGNHRRIGPVGFDPRRGTAVAA